MHPPGDNWREWHQYSLALDHSTKSPDGATTTPTGTYLTHTYTGTDLYNLPRTEVLTCITYPGLSEPAYLNILRLYIGYPGLGLYLGHPLRLYLGHPYT